MAVASSSRIRNNVLKVHSRAKHIDIRIKCVFYYLVIMRKCQCLRVRTNLKVTTVSTPLTRWWCGAERLSPDSLTPLPNRFRGGDGRHFTTILVPRAHRPSFLDHVVLKRGSLEAARVYENFGHPVTHVQKLQISLLMLITEFGPSPLHWGEKKFTS